MMTLLATTITFSHKYSQTVACCRLRRLKRNVFPPEDLLELQKAFPSALTTQEN